MPPGRSPLQATCRCLQGLYSRSCCAPECSSTVLAARAGARRMRSTLLGRLVSGCAQHKVQFNNVALSARIYINELHLNNVWSQIGLLLSSSYEYDQTSKLFNNRLARFASNCKVQLVSNMKPSSYIKAAGGTQIVTPPRSELALMKASKCMHAHYYCVQAL